MSREDLISFEFTVKTISILTFLYIKTEYSWDWEMMNVSF